MPGMWRNNPSGQKPDTCALEVRADHARCALACTYSSSDEFEADVINARRQAGAYATGRQSAVVAVAVALVLIATLVLVVPIWRFG
jgi:hypothetical protein